MLGRQDHDLKTGWRALEVESEAEVPRVLPADWDRVEEIGAGFFVRIDGLKAMMSVEQKGDDLRKWLHVSLSRENQLPSWEDIREVKNLFIGRNRRAIQVLPPEAEYVNLNPNVLHLWCCLNEDVLPDFRRCGTL